MDREARWFAPRGRRQMREREAPRGKALGPEGTGGRGLGDEEAVKVGEHGGLRSEAASERLLEREVGCDPSITGRSAAIRALIAATPASTIPREKHLRPAREAIHIPYCRTGP